MSWSRSCPICGHARFHATYADCDTIAVPFAEPEFLHVLTHVNKIPTSCFRLNAFRLKSSISGISTTYRPSDFKAEIMLTVSHQ